MQTARSVRAELLGKGDEREVDTVEHQLDAHEDHDGISAQQHATDTDREQDGGNAKRRTE